MMYTVAVDTEKLAADLNMLIGDINKAALDEFESTATEIQTEMREVGSPISYPVNWDSQKQKRFVMWKLSKEGNLPYRRTNAYVNNWTLAKFPDGIDLVNKHPAGAIGGTLEGGMPPTTWQSKIHVGRWKSLATVLLNKLNGFVDRIIARVK